jgi:glycosyltransferase involved in cell wall biosynthesis
MRIAHVVTYVSRDGSFGGPVAVADAQTRELSRRGHEVELIAGWDGIVELVIPGVRVHLFRSRIIPGLGFSGMYSLPLFKFLRRRARDFDVVHIHTGRHAISLVAARILKKSGVPYIIQTHGMVMPDERMKTRLVDRLSTRAALRGARSVLALTAAEKSGLHNVLPNIRDIRVVANGIAPGTFAKHGPSDDLALPEVIFLARLHPRKRVLAFAEMASILENRGLRATFSVVGPDEGDLERLEDFIKHEKLQSIRYLGSIPPGSAAQRLGRASVFVLPSFGEVFPMTVLESLSVGTPVVLTQDSGISSALASMDAALVTDGSPAELAGAVESLLSLGPEPIDLSAGMHRAMVELFSISAVAASLEEIYETRSGS